MVHREDVQSECFLIDVGRWMRNGATLLYIYVPSINVAQRVASSSSFFHAPFRSYKARRLGAFNGRENERTTAVGDGSWL